MKYVVLHREGTTWMNCAGNSLHVPFIDAESPEQAVDRAIEKTKKEAFMYLVMSNDGWHLVSPETKKWRVSSWSRVMD